MANLAACCGSLACVANLTTYAGPIVRHVENARINGLASLNVALNGALALSDLGGGVGCEPDDVFRVAKLARRREAPAFTLISTLSSLGMQQSGREAMAEYHDREAVAENNASRLKRLRLARDADAAAQSAEATRAPPKARRAKASTAPDEGLHPDQLDTEGNG